MDYLWDCNEFVDDNTLTVNINRLRKRLDGIGLLDIIERQEENKDILFHDIKRLFKRSKIYCFFEFSNADTCRIYSLFIQCHINRTNICWKCYFAYF